MTLDDQKSRQLSIAISIVALLVSLASFWDSRNARIMSQNTMRPFLSLEDMACREQEGCSLFLSNIGRDVALHVKISWDIGGPNEVSVVGIDIGAGQRKPVKTPFKRTYGEGRPIHGELSYADAGTSFEYRQEFCMSPLLDRNIREPNEPRPATQFSACYASN